jgi:hypothetical protein
MSNVKDDQASWPHWTMLGMGYFGYGTPEGRRVRNRCLAWLAVFAITGVAGAIHSLPLPVRLVCAAAVPLSWGGIVWSNVRYFHELDELNRLIQLEAAAFAYGIVVVLAAVWYTLWQLGILAAFIGSLHADASHSAAYLPLSMLPVFLLAEMLRGVALVSLARSRG